MKKFVISTLVLLGISLLSTDLMASTSEKKTQNPWEEFKSVIEAYHHSNVDFYYTSQDEQKAFLEAAAKIKLHLEEKQDSHAEAKLRKIDQTVAIFTFLWENQMSGDQEIIEPVEDIEIPEFE
ncbi:MAG: hypothetical protein IPP61_06075 [Cytophagaceae bacterium]|nr:hypothetical protein [Cytophagaceae bacterium]MBL0301906.1 hypothetical protein [Cytophagaceae bacterium]MBL0324733.1 hypothetical protein [Cytophagaceae bacterium]